MNLMNRLLSYLCERFCLNALAKENYEKAEMWLFRLEEFDPHPRRALHNLGLIRLGQKRYKEACLLFEKEFSNYGEDLELCRTLADLYYLQGKKDKALVFYEKIKMKKSKSLYHYVEERLHVCRDERHFSMAQVAQMLFEKGQSYLKEGHWEEALSFFEQAIVHDPTHYLALNNAGVIYLNFKKDKELAKKSFFKSMKLLPLPMTKYNLQICEEA